MAILRDHSHNFPNKLFSIFKGFVSSVYTEAFYSCQKMLYENVRPNNIC